MKLETITIEVLTAKVEPVPSIQVGFSVEIGKPVFLIDESITEEDLGRLFIKEINE